MIELTENEKEILENYKGYKMEDVLSAIDEGLIQWYDPPEDYMGLKEVACEYTKRLLKKVAEIRGIVVDSNDSFETKEIVQDEYEELTGFKPEYYEDSDDLKTYIESATNGMKAYELALFTSQFRGVHDSIRKFMANFIPKICNNLYRIADEIEKEERTEEPDEMFGNQTNDGQEGIRSDVFDKFDWSIPDEEWASDIENQQVDSKDEKLSDEELLECLKFLNTFQKLMQLKSNGIKALRELDEKAKSRKLDEYYSDKDFATEYERIMTHNTQKHKYFFHGTQDIESAESILKQGLGMMRGDLDSTTYEELSMDELLLYSRGFLGEIGNDAIVIIDQPVNEEGKRENIVQELEENQEINFLPSGLQGLDRKPKYIVAPKYIVGFVNKRDKKIIFNPKYYDYNRFVTQESEQTSFREKDIGGATMNVQTREKDAASNQINRDMNGLNPENPIDIGD